MARALISPPALRRGANPQQNREQAEHDKRARPCADLHGRVLPRGRVTGPQQARVTVTIKVSGHLHGIVATSRALRLASLTALAIGATSLPAGATKSVASKHTEVTPVSNTDMSARRKVRSKKVRSYERRRARHARVRHARRHAQHVRYPGGREAGLVPELRSLIADLQQRHGADSVRVISGRDSRGYRKSCHPSGQAFDAHVSRAVMADLRSRGFGLITYSGAMHHVHVSSCVREAGLRAHKQVGGRNIFARYMGRTRRGG